MGWGRDVVQLEFAFVMDIVTRWLVRGIVVVLWATLTRRCPPGHSHTLELVDLSRDEEDEARARGHMF